MNYLVNLIDSTVNIELKKISYTYSKHLSISRPEEGKTLTVQYVYEQLQAKLNDVGDDFIELEYEDGGKELLQISEIRRIAKAKTDG